MSASFEEDYDEIEKCLRQAQEEIGYALLSLSEKLQGTTQPVFSRLFSSHHGGDGINLELSSSSCGQQDKALQKPPQKVDFRAIFEEQPLETQLKKLELQLLVPPIVKAENKASHENRPEHLPRGRRRRQKSKMEYDDDHGDSNSEISSDFYTPPSGSDMDFNSPGFAFGSEVKPTLSTPFNYKPELSYFPEELEVNVEQKNEMGYIVSETASSRGSAPGVKVDSAVILDECLSPGVGSYTNFPFIDDDSAEIDEALLRGLLTPQDLDELVPHKVSETVDIVLSNENARPIEFDTKVVHRNIILDKSMESDQDMAFYSADEGMDSSFDMKCVKPKTRPRPKPRRKKSSGSTETESSTGSCSSEGRRVSDSFICDLRPSRSAKTEAKRVSLDLKLGISNSDLNPSRSDPSVCDSGVKATTTLEKNINHRSEKCNKEKVLFDNAEREVEEPGSVRLHKPDISAVFAYIENQMHNEPVDDHIIQDDVFRESDVKLENVEFKENNLSPDSNEIAMIDVGIETEYCEDWRNSHSFKQRKLSPIIDEEMPKESYEYVRSLTDTDCPPMAPPRKNKRYKSMREPTKTAEVDNSEWRFQSLRKPKVAQPQDENDNTLKDFEKYLSVNTITALSNLSQKRADPVPDVAQVSAMHVMTLEPDAEEKPKKKESRLSLWQKRIRKRSAPPSLLFFRRKKDGDKPKDSALKPIHDLDRGSSKDLNTVPPSGVSKNDRLGGPAPRTHHRTLSDYSTLPSGPMRPLPPVPIQPVPNLVIRNENTDFPPTGRLAQKRSSLPLVPSHSEQSTAIPFTGSKENMFRRGSKESIGTCRSLKDNISRSSRESISRGSKESISRGSGESISRGSKENLHRGSIENLLRRSMENLLRKSHESLPKGSGENVSGPKFLEGDRPASPKTESRFERLKKRLRKRSAPPSLLLFRRKSTLDKPQVAKDDLVIPEIVAEEGSSSGSAITPLLRRATTKKDKKDKDKRQSVGDYENEVDLPYHIRKRQRNKCTEIKVSNIPKSPPNDIIENKYNQPDVIAQTLPTRLSRKKERSKNVLNEDGISAYQHIETARMAYAIASVEEMQKRPYSGVEPCIPALSSPTNQRLPGLLPAGSHPGTLLDAMHRKFYSHQYEPPSRRPESVIKLGVRATTCRRRSPSKSATSVTDSDQSLSSHSETGSPAYYNTSRTRFDFGIHVDRPPGYVRDRSPTKRHVRRPSLDSVSSTDRQISPESDTMSMNSFVAMQQKSRPSRRSSVDSSDTTSVNSVASSSSIRSSSTCSSHQGQESSSSSRTGVECNLKLVKHKAINIPSLADPFESCKIDADTAEDIKQKSTSQTSASSQSTLCSHGSQVLHGLGHAESTSTVGDAVPGDVGDSDDMTYTKSLDRSKLKKAADYETRSLPNRSRRRRNSADAGTWKSEQEIPEIEALEACKWLRAAGFPQYAQMYEDQQFPIDIQAVERDHDFLDEDSMQSLFRRLNTLNKCASMKIDTNSRKTVDESDEEDQCALSDRWKFQRSNRRWSRRLDEDNALLSVPDGAAPSKHGLASGSSHDSVITDNDISSHADESPLLSPKDQETLMLPSPDAESYDVANANTWTSPRLRRAASEKLKSAKNFLKRIDTLKSSKRRKKTGANRDDISGPKVVDSDEMKDRIERLQCIDIQVTSELSPTSSESCKNFPAFSDADTSPEADKRCFHQNFDLLNSSFSDTEEGIHGPFLRHRRNLSDQGVGNSELVTIPKDYVPGTFPKVHAGDYIRAGHGNIINYRTGSFNLGNDSAERDEFVNSVQRRVKSEKRSTPNRASFYDNVPQSENPHHELDQVLNELFQNINSLPNYQDNEDYLTIDTNKSDLSLELGDEFSLDSMKSGTLHGEISSQSETEANASATESIGASKMDVDNLDQSEHSESEIKEATGLKAQENDLGEARDGQQSKQNDDSLSSPHETSDTELHHGKDEGVVRERRDSGMGSSLTRAPSDRRRPRIRWHSFQKSHRPSLGSRNLQISNLSAGQLMVLRKLSLLKLTAMMERYSPSNKTGWNWGMPKFIKRFRAPDYKDKSVFGVPILVTLQRTLQPLPQCILYAMRYLRRTAPDAVGIFRKSGVRSRIQKLKNQIEADPHMTEFDAQSEYDVADMVKQYFRELPECLLTNKISETLVSIYTFVPAEQRSEACTAAIMLMPDENREVLQSLLLFLSDLADHSDTNQMNASNLSVCFAPSLFNVLRSYSTGTGNSPRRNRRATGIPDQKELLEQKATHECLTHMIKDCKKLFMIPEDTIAKCKFSYIERGDPVPLDHLCKGGPEGKPNYTAYIETCVQGILKESRDKFKGWVSVSPHNGVDIAYKKLGDGHPLRLWKCGVEVEAPPVEVLNRILRERHLWDDDLLKWRIVERLNKSTEIFQYVCNSMAPHPTRDYCTLRAWKTGLPKGSCVLVATSIEHPEAPVLGGVRGVVLASRYLIEPCGSGKSRVTHIVRTDARGRTPDWYNKAFGQLSGTLMRRIRDSFKHGAVAEGPETKV
ncbi:uncharacterized protein LOC135494012 isoform X2 [Lineus longissimus]|uniref:uncharacterized protein LOC135494012 isoform X2 n=1 Tax=Lineus longissimus TaxID=88925 RepID=UPI00315D2718